MADAHVGTTPYWFRFIDWPLELGGKAKPAMIDTWLYIFQADAKEARLQAEIFLRASGKDEETGQSWPERYHAVDLQQHWGRDQRPYAERGGDACWLDDSQVHVLEQVRYYILCSPFQLAWSRIKELADTRDPQQLRKLAFEQRGLGTVLLDEGHTTRGPGSRLRIKAIRTPWGDGQALSRQFLAKLREWERRANTEERRQWRTLLAGIDMLSGGHRFKGLLDEDYLKNHVYAELLEDNRLFDEVEAAAGKLILHLSGSAMTAMELDAEATTDPDARGAFAAIRLMLEARLAQTKLGQQYRAEWYPKHEKLVLFDVVADVQKGVRKGAKAVWAWAKSWGDVAAGYPPGSKLAGQVPGGLVGYARGQARVVARVELLTDTAWIEAVSEERARKVLTDAEFSEWQQQRHVVKLAPDENPPPWLAKLKDHEPIPTKFAKESVRELKRKVNENPRLTGLFALVDTVNLMFTLRDLLEGDAKTSADRTKKAAATTSALFSFLSSALSFAKTQTVHLDEVELVHHWLTQGSDARARTVLSASQSQGTMRRALGRAAYSRSLMAGLGMVGAAFDMVGSSVDIVRGLQEAKTGDSPDRIWMLPGLGFLGSAASLVAYAFLSSTPPGAILLVVGAALGATATIGSIVSPAYISSEVEKWLMHSFVGKHRLSAISETETFTSGKSLVDYHKRLDLQVSGLNQVLFEFESRCEMHEEDGQPLLKVDVRFRQLRSRSKIELKAFGYQQGRWLPVFHSLDWRPPLIAPPVDRRTGLREDGPGRLAGNLYATGFKKMKVSIQIDVIGDGTFLYPPTPRELECEA